VKEEKQPCPDCDDYGYVLVHQDDCAEKRGLANYWGDCCLYSQRYCSKCERGALLRRFDGLD
jgi:hypothetical protein